MNAKHRTEPKPAWLKVRLPSDPQYFQVADLVRRGNLHTICRSARCPNIGECWAARTATFLVMGDVCTRHCAFCAVTKGAPAPLDPGEPARIAAAAEAMGLSYAVVTSVTRDDLPDSGAAHFAAVIRALRAAPRGIRVEALVPDFGGDEAALAVVLDAGPVVLNHNLETVEALYPAIGRPAANYSRSLDLLAAASRRGLVTKSGLMIGLGEDDASIRSALADLRAAGCGLLTIGQYLQPGPAHPPVARYYDPAAFDAWRAFALSLGFRDAAAGPLVRSSYGAERLYRSATRETAPCAS